MSQVVNHMHMADMQGIADYPCTHSKFQCLRHPIVERRTRYNKCIGKHNQWNVQGLKSYGEDARGSKLHLTHSKLQGCMSLFIDRRYDVQQFTAKTQQIWMSHVVKHIGEMQGMIKHVWKYTTIQRPKSSVMERRFKVQWIDVKIW